MVKIEITVTNIDASQGYIEQYVRDALSIWGKQYHPTDPLSNGLNVNDVKIKKED